MSATDKVSSRLFWVDWIRALAAFAVLITHTHAVTWVFWSELPSESKTTLAALFYTAPRFGYDAVIIFFTLSGFLVGGRLIDRVISGKFEPVGYAVDRVARVYVPLVPALLLSLCILSCQGQSLDAGVLMANLFHLQGICSPVYANNGPLWTLAYETWFYVSAGLLASMWATKHSSRSMLLCLAVCALAVFCVLQPIFLICWLIGAFAYRLGASPRPIFDGVLGLVITVTGLVWRQLSVYKTYNDPSPSTQAASLLICLGVGLLLSAIAHKEPSHWLRRLERAGAWCAAPSYTLYLIHVPVLGLISLVHPHKASAPNAATLAFYGVKIALCISAALIMYWLFERRTTTVRRWLYDVVSRRELVEQGSANNTNKRA